MYFDEIFSKAITYWDNEIDISDGTLDDEGNYFSANLSMAWFAATDKFESEGNDNQWVDLMHWSMNRTLQKIAQTNSKTGATKLEIRSIDPTIFHTDYKTVLTESKNKTLISGYKGIK